MLCLLLISQLLQGLGLEDSELLNQFEEENWVFEISNISMFCFIVCFYLF